MANIKLLITGCLLILIIFLLLSCSEESTAPEENDLAEPTDKIIIWEQTSGPPGEGVWSLAINSFNHIFAGTAGEGVFRSTNNGNTWYYIGLKDTVSFFTTAIFSLAINSSDHVFAGTNDGVYRSTDNGDTWVLLRGMISPNAIAINASGHIFAGGYNGFIRSMDSGDSWTSINYGQTNLKIHSIVIDSNGVIFLGAREGEVYRTNDNGEIWAKTDLNIPEPSQGLEYQRSVLSIRINALGNLIAGTNGAGLYRSNDIGIYANSWTEVDNGLTDKDIRAIVINVDGHLFAGTAGTGVFRSTNHGTTWTRTGGTGPSFGVLSLAINSTGEIFAGTWTGGGVFRTTESTIEKY